MMNEMHQPCSYIQLTFNQHLVPSSKGQAQNHQRDSTVLSDRKKKVKVFINVKFITNYSLGFLLLFFWQTLQTYMHACLPVGAQIPVVSIIFYAVISWLQLSYNTVANTVLLHLYHLISQVELSAASNTTAIRPFSLPKLSAILRNVQLSSDLSCNFVYAFLVMLQGEGADGGLALPSNCTWCNILGGIRNLDDCIKRCLSIHTQFGLTADQLAECIRECQKRF